MLATGPQRSMSLNVPLETQIEPCFVAVAFTLELRRRPSRYLACGLLRLVFITLDSAIFV